MEDFDRTLRKNRSRVIILYITVIYTVLTIISTVIFLLCDFTSNFTMALDNLCWTDKNTRSVRDYQKKIESGEIKPIKLTKSFKDIVA